MKIFKIITIGTVANGFKLIEDSDYFKDELTTTTPTTTTDTTTTDTTTNYTTTTATTTTGKQHYEAYLCWAIRTLGLNYFEAAARDSIIEIPGLKLRRMIKDVHHDALRMMARDKCISNIYYNRYF